MKNTLYTLLLFLCFTTASFSQNSNIAKATNLFENRSYLKAANLFEKIENKDKSILEKLGDCYYFNTNMAEANIWYSKLFELYENEVDNNYLFRYAQTLKGLEKYSEADKWFNKYFENDKPYIASDKLTSLTTDSKRPYVVHPLSINSAVSDFGVSLNANKAYFASSRNKGEIYEWNNQPYLDLFSADISENGDLVNSKPLNTAINSNMHESNAVLTKDGKTMYFTRNNFTKRSVLYNRQKVNNLKIFKAELIDDEWKNIKALPFNSENYSVEHPSLSYDEKTLYFASDMPGTIGSFDIFSVTINDDNTFGTPKNLGENVNTIHREQFPYVSKENNLYFSSDGHVGFGGLDIFKYEITSNTKPVNLSSHLNSNADDFALIIDETSETGYFSSNRLGGQGDDDIYRFTRNKQFFVNGLVQDKNSLKLLPGSLVTLFDDNQNSIGDAIVKDDAAYSFEIENNKNYKIRGTRKLYLPYEVKFSTDNEGNVSKNILLLLESYEDAEKKIVVEDGKTQIKINPIYFDFNKWNIREDAALELNSVVDIMKKYSEMVIEIGAHTDCRGSDEYNLQLSHKRAKSVREYLVSQGIPDKNVKSIGYGEMQPLNHCVKEGICKEKEYDINRRCEFVILN